MKHSRSEGAESDNVDRKSRGYHRAAQGLIATAQKEKSGPQKPQPLLPSDTDPSPRLTLPTSLLDKDTELKLPLSFHLGLRKSLHPSGSSHGMTRHTLTNQYSIPLAGSLPESVFCYQLTSSMAACLVSPLPDSDLACLCIA